MAAHYKFPSPIGGAPDALDLVPSIVFAVLWILVLPVILWRMAHPRSRSVVLIITAAFSLEHAISFSLRAGAAMSHGLRKNENLETYFQMSYSSFFISIGQDLVNILRTLLVASTLGGDMVARHTLTPPHIWKARKSGAVELAPRSCSSTDTDGVYEVVLDGNDEVASTSGPEFQFVDQAGLRQNIRTRLGIVMLLFLIAVGASSTASSLYESAINGHNALVVRCLWYTSDTISIALLVTTASVAIFALFKMPRVPRASLLCIILVACLLCIIAVYRITVFSRSTTSLFSKAPGAQNTAREKAMFYGLHAAPEFFAAATLVSLNARRVFGTGTWGDLRARDPKPEVEPEDEDGAKHGRGCFRIWIPKGWRASRTKEVLS